MTFVPGPLYSFCGMSSSKERKRRQKRRGSERHKELKLAYEESKKALEREQKSKRHWNGEATSVKYYDLSLYVYDI